MQTHTSSFQLFILSLKGRTESRATDPIWRIASAFRIHQTGQQGFSSIFIHARVKSMTCFRWVLVTRRDPVYLSDKSSVGPQRYRLSSFLFRLFLHDMLDVRSPFKRCCLLCFFSRRCSGKHKHRSLTGAEMWLAMVQFPNRIHLTA